MVVCCFAMEMGLLLKGQTVLINISKCGRDHGVIKEMNVFNG